MPETGPHDPLIIITRLAEFCQSGYSLRNESDPWEFMLRKLLDTEDPITDMKERLFQNARGQLLEELRCGPLNAERCSEYRLIFERLVSPGEFADVAIHLFPEAPNQAAALRQILGQVKATNLFLEEKKTAGQRSPSWEKLVSELYRRLNLDALGTILVRKPRTPLRQAMVLRRVRRNVAEYCCVVHIPTDPNETFTPFMLPRIEALIAANLRFLRKYR
ncbi:MAG: hypothetical protein WC881_05115 [Elusimicrobiota bacterium]|jgi:hypothetical protein